MSEKTQKNMRLSASTRDRFDAICRDAGKTPDAVLTELLAYAEVDRLKAMVPDAATDVDAFDAHIDAIRDVYHAAIQRSADAYDIAAEKVRSRLDSLASLVPENHRLQDESKQLKQELDDVRTENRRLAADLAAATAAGSEAEELRAQVTQLREQMVSLREQHAVEVSQLQDDLRSARTEAFCQLKELIGLQSK